MKIVIYADNEEKKRVGHFYIPNNADEEWMKKNTPSLLYGAKVLTEEYTIGEKSEN